jgi:RecB family exonuclease
VRDIVVAVKEDDPLAPVTVAVPSRRAGIALRRLLASGALGSTGPDGGLGLVNVRFEPLDRIAELLGAPGLAAAGRRPATTAVQAEALRGELRADPGVFRAVAGHPATARSLDRAFAELRPCSDATLDRLAVLSPRAHDVVRLFRAVRARLAVGWYDEHDLAIAAADAVRAGSPALADVGHLVVYLPRRLTPGQAELVAAFGSAATTVDVDVTGAAIRADAIVTTTDADEEVRAVVRAVAERLDRGIPLHRMAILYGASEPYALLAAQHLDAGRLPWNGPSVRSLAQTVAGTGLLGLLALPDRGWGRADVVAWLSAAPVLDTPGGQWVPSARWDKLSREAGVIEGADQWDERLEQHEARLVEQQHEVQSGAGDDSEAWAARIAADIAHTERLRAFVAELVAAADPSGRDSWTAFAGWATGLLDRYLGTDLTHSRWPEHEQDAWRSVHDAVERLAGLDALGVATDPTTFRRAVERELEAPAARNGRFGDGVYVGSVRSAAGLDVDVVFVLGMVEGTLPGRVRGDALLPEHERAAVGSELAGSGSSIDEERADLVLALASATTERVLLHPQSDLRRGRARLPSRWLLEAAGAMAGKAVFSDELESVAKGDDRFHTVTSFEGGTYDVTAPMSLSDYDLRELLHWRHDGGALERHYLAADDPVFAAGLVTERRRRSTQFTEYDGNLSGEAVRAPDSLDALSPTSLEQYAGCPFRYLLGRVLRVAAVDKPEEITELSARDKGSLVHEVLEQYILGVLAGEPRTLDRLLAIAADACRRYEALGLTGKPLRWRYDQRLLRRELARFHAEDTLHPLAAELAFGLHDTPPVEVTIGAGRTLRFHGMADRVDRADDGSLVVTDYKTGSRTSYEKLDRGDPVMRGTKLQLPLYAMAARDRFGDGRPVRSRYWFVSERGEFKSIGYEVDEAVLGRFDDVVTTIADGIASGSFPARPGAPDTRTGGWVGCTWCDYDSLCTRDRARAWERKKGAPALAEYVDLAEGEPAPADAEVAL